MGRLGRRRAGRLGVLLVALVVALQVVGSRLTPLGGPQTSIAGAARWALLLWGLWYAAARLRGR